MIFFRPTGKNSFFKVPQERYLKFSFNPGEFMDSRKKHKVTKEQNCVLYAIVLL